MKTIITLWGRLVLCLIRPALEERDRCLIEEDRRRQVLADEFFSARREARLAEDLANPTPERLAMKARREARQRAAAARVASAGEDSRSAARP